jgi:hypothetical protein
MKLRIAITLAALAVAGSAFAQPPAGGGGGTPSPEMQAARKAVMESCAADQKTFCDGKTGRESMMCLMRDNVDKVSQPCKDAIAKMRAARQGGGAGGGR